MKLPILGCILFVTVLLACSPAAIGTKTPVTAKDFDDQWPLTVSQGIIETYEYKGSYGQIEVTFVTQGGETYGLNGTAQSHGWRNIHEITKKSGDVPSDANYQDVGGLISRGLSAHYAKAKKQ